MINWQIGMMSPLFMASSFQTAAMGLLIEAHQKKMMRFMTTGVWQL